MSETAKTSSRAGWERAARWTAACLPVGVIALGMMPEAALAQAGGVGGSGYSDEELPWYGILTAIRDSLCGPVAQYAIVIAIVITGLTVAFGELQGMFSTMVRFLFGATLALQATQFLGVFGFADAGCGPGVSGMLSIGGG